MSSSTHGRLERVDARPQRGRAEVDRRARRAIRPSRAASLRSIGIASSRLPSRMSVLVAMSAALATIFSLEKSRKWIIREGRNGISASGAGAPMASGLRKSRGLRMVGDDIDSPVNLLRCYSLQACAGSCSPRSSSLSPSPAAAQAHRVRRARPGPVRRHRSPRCATPCPTGRRPALKVRSPGPQGSTTSPSRCRSTSRSHALVALVAVVNRRPRGSQAPDLGQHPARDAAVARACARRSSARR